MTTLAQKGEALGFASMTIPDHIVIPKSFAHVYPYAAGGKPTFPDAWLDQPTAIAWLAAVTTSIKLMTSVMVVPHRSPVHTAKVLATIDVLSEGRLIVGCGAGWMREEFELLDQSFKGRGRRMVEAIDIMKRLWEGGIVQTSGEFYKIPPLQINPTPIAPIPFWGGGTGEIALTRAATLFDGWLSEVQDTDELPGFIETLRSRRADSPKSNEPFAINASIRDAYTLDHFRRLRDLGVTHVNVVPWLLQRMMEDDVEKKCDGIRRFGDEIIAEL